MAAHAPEWFVEPDLVSELRSQKLLQGFEPNTNKLRSNDQDPELWESIAAASILQCLKLTAEPDLADLEHAYIALPDANVLEYLRTMLRQPSEQNRVTWIKHRSEYIRVTPETPGLASVMNLSPAAVKFLLKHPDLRHILRDALPEAGKYFGKLTLEVDLVTDPEAGASGLLALIVTRLPVDVAMQRLDQFDDGWFLQHWPNLGGRLNFGVSQAIV